MFGFFFAVTATGRVIEVDIIRITRVKYRAYRNQKTGIGATVGDGDIAPPATRPAASRIIKAHIDGHTEGTG